MTRGSEKQALFASLLPIYAAVFQARRQTKKRTGAGCSAPLSRGGALAALVILGLPVALPSEADDAGEGLVLSRAAAEVE